MKNYIIPIFIPHFGCQHACVFCNQHKITGVETNVTADEIKGIIAGRLAMVRGQRHVEVAFYGGSFTALSLARQTALLEPVHAFLQRGAIQAIRLSTRPDCINEEILQNLRAHGVRTVELGAQSFDDAVLYAARRGHTAEVIRTGARSVQRSGLQLGLQLMPGLPGDTWRSILLSTEETIRIKPDFVRIYPTLVLRDTPLAALYEKGLYAPLSLQQAVAYSMLMKASFAARGIAVIRTGLQATEQLSDPDVVLAGPYHPAFGELADAYAFRLLVCRLFEQISPMRECVVIRHHPKDASRVRGNKNENTKLWQSLYRLREIAFRADGERQGQLLVSCRGENFFLSRRAMEHI